jgi:hypothetical protein
MEVGRQAALKSMGAILVVGVVIAAILPTHKQASDEDVKSLIAQEEKLDEQCRDGPASNAAEMEATQKICNQRDPIVSKIMALGWCWGHGEQIDADRKWEPCQSAPQQTTMETPPQSADNDTVQFDPNAARRREILEEIQADTRSCMYRMARTQLMIGNKSRSDILSKMIGVCGNEYVGKMIAFRSTKWGAGQNLVSVEEAKNFLTVESNRQLELASQ